MIKKLFIVIFAAVFFAGCSSTSTVVGNGRPQPSKTPEEVKQALSGLIEERDEVEEVTFYVSQTTQANEGKSDVSVYFSKDDEGNIGNLRYSIRYVGDSKLNNSWTTINADGEKFLLKPITKKMNSWSQYIEVNDGKMYLSDLKMIKKIANSKKAILRFGTVFNDNDLVLSENQKQAILKVLKAYKDAGGLNDIYGDEL